MRLCNILVLIVILLMGSNMSLSQNPLMRKFTTKEGLPGLYITDIIQDRDGFIWISTEHGVCRFDGHKFHHYTIIDGLTNLSTVALKEDSKGRIWFLGAEGTVSYWYKGKIYNENS